MNAPAAALEQIARYALADPVAVQVAARHALRVAARRPGGGQALVGRRHRIEHAQAARRAEARRARLRSHAVLEVGALRVVDARLSGRGGRDALGLGVPVELRAAEVLRRAVVPGRSGPLAAGASLRRRHGPAIALARGRADPERLGRRPHAVLRARGARRVGHARTVQGLGQLRADDLRHAVAREIGDQRRPRQLVLEDRVHGPEAPRPVAPVHAQVHGAVDHHGAAHEIVAPVAVHVRELDAQVPRDPRALVERVWNAHVTLRAPRPLEARRREAPAVRVAQRHRAQERAPGDAPSFEVREGIGPREVRRARSVRRVHLEPREPVVDPLPDPGEPHVARVGPRLVAQLDPATRRLAGPARVHDPREPLAEVRLLARGRARRVVREQDRVAVAVLDPHEVPAEQRRAADHRRPTIERGVLDAIDLERPVHVHDRVVRVHRELARTARPRAGPRDDPLHRLALGPVLRARRAVLDRGARVEQQRLAVEAQPVRLGERHPARAARLVGMHAARDARREPRDLEARAEQAVAPARGVAERQRGLHPRAPGRHGERQRERRVAVDVDAGRAGQRADALRRDHRVGRDRRRLTSSGGGSMHDATSAADTSTRAASRRGANRSPVPTRPPRVFARRVISYLRSVSTSGCALRSRRAGRTADSNRHRPSRRLVSCSRSEFIEPT